MHFLPFSTIKLLTLRMDHAKLLDVLTSLPVSRSILPRAVYFATSRPANHAICSFIDSIWYASGPIRRCLFIAYIIICKADQRTDCTETWIDTLNEMSASNISNDFNPLLHNNASWCPWNVMYLKILWKIEHLLFWSKCSIIHNIFKSIIQNLIWTPLEIFQCCCLTIENVMI